MAAWGRRVQFLGALALMLAPFLPWAQARVLGIPLGLPGAFLHGALCLALGLLVALAYLVGLRSPALGVGASLVSAAVTGWDLNLILHRTEYVLRRLQLSLAELNNVLAQLNLQPIDLYTHEATPWGHVGVGVWVALGGCAVVLAGAGLEAAGRRCRGCGYRLNDAMIFCPGCGKGPENGCSNCGKRLRSGYRFCPGCGHSLEEDGVGLSRIGSALV